MESTGRKAEMAKAGRNGRYPTRKAEEQLGEKERGGNAQKPAGYESRGEEREQELKWRKGSNKIRFTPKMVWKRDFLQY